MKIRGNLIVNNIVQRKTYIRSILTGANQFTLVYEIEPDITLDAGWQITFLADATISGSTTLILPGGIEYRTIKKNVNEDLDANDILAGQIVTVTYDGTNFQLSGGVGGGGGIGESGFSGFSGQDGLQGESGFSGFSGTNGASGFSGTNGASGFSGWSGISGENGLQGESGFSGTNGSSGFSGFSGFSGENGNGIGGVAVVLGNDTTLHVSNDVTPCVTMYSPFAFTITAEKVFASLAVVGSTASTLDIHKNGTTIFSTKITIDATEPTSSTAASCVINGAAGSVAVADKLEFFIDAAGSGCKGAKITLL